MRVVAALACRNNSNRLYGKPLQKLGPSLTVVDYIITRLKEMSQIDEVVLAISETKDNLIYTDVAKKHGLKYVLGDDKDVLKRLIDACRAGVGDTVFRMTSESPFPFLEGLGLALDSHREVQADYTTYAKLPDGSSFEIINLKALESSHARGNDRHRSELCTLYINENRSQFKLNVLEVDELFQKPDLRLTIDFPEDLILCRKIVQRFGEKEYIPYGKLIPFLMERPDLLKLVEGLNDKEYVKPYF